MSKQNNTLVYVGGAAVLAVLAYNYFGKSATVTPLATTDPAATSLGPAVPDLSGLTVNNYGGGYFDAVLYPAMLKANPGIGDPGYTLSDSEITQLLQNYADLRVGLQQRVSSSHGLNDVVRTFWHEEAVPQKRVFLPLNPPSAVPYTGPVNNANSSGGSSSWLKTLGTVASVAAVLVGVDDTPSTSLPLLNDYDVEILLTGSGIALDILPFYYKKNNLALQAEDRIESLVTQYTR